MSLWIVDRPVLSPSVMAGTLVRSKARNPGKYQRQALTNAGEMLEAGLVMGDALENFSSVVA